MSLPEFLMILLVLLLIFGGSQILSIGRLLSQEKLELKNETIENPHDNPSA